MSWLDKFFLRKLKTEAVRPASLRSVAQMSVLFGNDLLNRVETKQRSLPKM